jgi:hypothetical protein
MGGEEEINAEHSEEHLFDVLNRAGIFDKKNYLILKKEEQTTITEEMVGNINLLVQFVQKHPFEGTFRISCRPEDINQVVKGLPSLPTDLDPVVATCSLKYIWRNAELVPKLYYYPMLRLLHVSSTVKRVEFLRRMLELLEPDRRALIRQMILLAKDLVDSGETKLDQHGMAVLLGPVLFSQKSRPALPIDIPLEIEVKCDVYEGDEKGPKGVVAHDLNFERNLALKEADWMNEIFYFILNNEQRIFSSHGKI